MATALERAREAYSRRRFDVAYAGFGDAGDDAEFGVDDLAAYADAAWWVGHTDRSLELSEQVYRRCLQGDQSPTAARLAVEIGFLWMLRGEAQIGSGWFSRAQRLLADVPDAPERGYLRYLEVLEALSTTNYDAAIAISREMQTLADRHDDPTLCAIALVLEGIATVRSGDLARGFALCDEAMLAVRSGAVEPSWAGNLYCQIMGLCFDVADPVRARAWTDATERWCDRFSNAAMFTGICRIHRAQLLNLEGAWDEAEARAHEACRDLADMNVEVVAAGHYEIGELRRMRGDVAGAERAFARAHELGRDPQPGLARLRLTQGDTNGAQASLDVALAGLDDRLTRTPLLTAQLEVAQATGDADLAASVARELVAISEVFPTPGLRAAAQRATGVAQLLADEAADAARSLRDALRSWRELAASYDTARTQVSLAAALERCGDHEGASRERQQAAATFEQLGAEPDLRALGDGPPAGPTPAGLSARETQVLALVADGATNATIAERLTISERTVERHVSNIFLKLQVSSRTQAARFAYVHGLVSATPRPPGPPPGSRGR